jgi:hypothetical protein
MSRLWVLPVLGLIAAVVVACSSDDEVVPSSVASSTAPTTQTAKPTLSPAPTPSLAQSPTIAGTSTYTESTNGYSFDYPTAWYLSPPKDNGGDLILYSYDPASVVGDGRPVPPDKIKVFIWIAEGVTGSIEQWLDEGRTGPGAITPVTLVSRSNDTLGGRNWVVQVVEAEGVQSIGYYFSLGGGRIFAVNAVPANSKLLPELESSISSLRLLQ